MGTRNLRFPNRRGQAATDPTAAVMARYTVVRREIEQLQARREHTIAIREHTIEMRRLRSTLEALAWSRRGAA